MVFFIVLAVGLLIGGALFYQPPWGTIAFPQPTKAKPPSTVRQPVIDLTVIKSSPQTSTIITHPTAQTTKTSPATTTPAATPTASPTTTTTTNTTAPTTTTPAAPGNSSYGHTHQPVTN